MSTLAPLPVDITGLVLGFLPVADIASARTTCRRIQTAADCPALWGILLRERARVIGVAPAGDASNSRSFARMLCLGKREFDGPAGAHSDARDARVAPCFDQVLRCNKHGRLMQVADTVARLMAAQDAAKDAMRMHRGVDATPVAVTAIVVPSLDPTTLSLVQAACESTLGVRFSDPDHRDDCESQRHGEQGVPVIPGGGMFAGVPQRFPSLSVCTTQTRLPLDANALVNRELRKRCPAEVRRVVILASIPLLAFNGETDDAGGSEDEVDGWVDEAAVIAAAGRTLLAAMACASNVVCVNGSPECDMRRWHALLRRATRVPAWDHHVLATRRDSACTMTYVLTQAAYAKSLDKAGPLDPSASFDPLADLMMGTGQAGAIAMADANWFDLGLVSKSAVVRGVVVAHSNVDTGASQGRAERFIDAEDAAAIADLRAAAANAPRASAHRAAARFPADLVRTLAQAAGRPFMLLPLTFGSARGGFYSWCEVSALIGIVSKRAANPAAGLEQLMARAGASSVFEYLSRGAADFYTSAMNIELDDAARPNVTHWVDVAGATRDITQGLDRAYATTSVATADGSSTHPHGGTSLADDDDEDTVMESSAGQDQLQLDLEEGDDTDELDREGPTLDDFLPMTPGEIVAPGDLRPSDPSSAAALPSPPTALPPVLVPMDVDDMLDAHERFSAAAMRKLVHCMGGSAAQTLGTAPPIATSVDVETGHELLESLKTDLSDTFRTLWTANQHRSRLYCEAVASRTFSRIARTYTDAGVTILRDSPTAPRQWYHDVRACIEEYVVRALGGRVYEVLATHTLGILIADFRRACADQGVRDQSLADLCASSLENEVASLHRRHMTDRDTRLSRRQLTIAKLGIFIGCEWTAAAARSDLAKLATELNEDVIADWASCTHVHRLRLAAGGVEVPEAAVRTEEQWAQWVAGIRGHLEGRAKEALRSMHAAEADLGLRTTEAHNTSALREIQRRERAESATGVVRLFNMMRTPFASSAVEDDAAPSQ